MHITHVAHGKYARRMAENAIAAGAGVRGVGIGSVGVEAVEGRALERGGWRQTSSWPHSSMRVSAPKAGSRLCLTHLDVPGAWYVLRARHRGTEWIW